MQALVDRHVLVHAIQAAGVVVALVEFDQRQVIGPIAVNLVRAREAERRLPAKIACGHQQVHGAERIHIEVVVGNSRCFVMGRLGGRVNDEFRPLGIENLPDGLPIAYIDGQVAVTGQRPPQLLHHRMRRALLAEKLPAHIVIDSHNLPAFRGKLADAFRADQSAGTGDKSLIHDVTSIRPGCLTVCTHNNG